MVKVSMSVFGASFSVTGSKQECKELSSFLLDTLIQKIHTLAPPSLPTPSLVVPTPSTKPTTSKPATKKRVAVDELSSKTRLEIPRASKQRPLNYAHVFEISACDEIAEELPEIGEARATARLQTRRIPFSEVQIVESPNVLENFPIQNFKYYSQISKYFPPAVNEIYYNLPPARKKVFFHAAADFLSKNDVIGGRVDISSTHVIFINELGRRSFKY